MDRGFSSVHPLVCFLYYFMMLAFAMLLFHPVYLAIALTGAAAFSLLRDRGKTLAGSWRFYAAMSAVVLIANPLVSHRGRTILFYLADNPVTLESVVYGLVMALSLLTILINFTSLQQVVGHHKFLHLFSSSLPRTSFLIMMAVRFIPLLRVRLKQISVVQKTRGIDISSGSFAKRAKDGMKLLNILVTWSLEEALQTADSMKARGYGLTRRSSFFDYKMSRYDWGLLALVLALGAITMTGWYMGYGTLKIYPALGELLVKPQQLLYYSAFLIMAFIPAIEEGKDALAWRLLK